MRKITSIALAFLFAATSYAQWVGQTVPFPNNANIANALFYDVEVVDSNNVWAIPVYYNSAGTQVASQDYCRTIDGGKTWTVKSMNVSPSTLSPANIWPVSTTKCYAAMYSNDNNSVDRGGVYVTKDGGSSWTKQTTATFSGKDAFADFIGFFNSTDGVVVGDPNGGYFEIYTTNDAGTTWVKVPQANIPAYSSGDAGIINNFSIVGNHIWFGTRNGDVYHSSDKGYNWTSAKSQLPSSDLQNQISFVDTLHGLFSKYNSSTKKTELSATNDGGKTWNIITPKGAYLTRDLDAIPGTNVFISTGTSLVSSSYSTDYGVTWDTLSMYNFQTAIDFASPTVGFTGGSANFLSPYNAYKYSIAIDANDEMCSGVKQQVSVPVVFDATSYNWSLPNGWTGTSTTRNIEVIPGATAGTISVTVNNATGAYPTLTKAISVITSVPNAPGAIKGPTVVLTGKKYLYTIPYVAGTHSYKWSGPAGWSGKSYGDTLEVTPDTIHGGDITVVDVNACGESVESKITVANHGITGVETINNAVKFSIMPNPSTGIITIMSDVKNTTSTLRVLDIVGNEVYTTTLNKNVETLDLSDKAKGVYFIKVEDSVKKLILE